MKQKLLKKSLFFINTFVLSVIACAIILLPSCKHAEIACETCKMNPPTKEVNVDVGKITSIKTNFWDEPDNHYHFGSTRSLTDGELNYVVIDYLSVLPESGAQNVSIVIYTNKPYGKEKDTVIDKKDIQGYSMYFVKDKKFRHRLYVRGDEGNFRIIPELNCEATGISSNHIYIIAELYFFGKYAEVSAIEMTCLPAYSTIKEQKLYHDNTLGKSLGRMERKH